MSIVTQISAVATELAGHAQGRAFRLQEQKFEIETRLREIEAQLHAANLAYDRLASFQPEIGRDFQCPRCWIEHETRAVLAPIGGGTRHADFFRCETCAFELEARF